MERNKGMAILIAIATAMLVIVAGKSCADDIQKKNNARRAQQPASSQQSTTYGFDEDFIPVTDIPTETAATEPATEKMYKEVTNILGSVIETIPITTEPSAASETTAQGATTTKSILDEYNEKNSATATSTLPPIPTKDANASKSTEPIVIELH